MVRCRIQKLQGSARGRIVAGLIRRLLERELRMADEHVSLRFDEARKLAIRRPTKGGKPGAAAAVL